MADDTATIDAPAPPAESTPAPPETTSTPEPVVSGPWIKDDGTFVSDWTQHLPEDVRGEATGMKLGERVKSVADLARFTVNSQRLIGKKGIIPPSEKSTPEEVSEYRRAMGVPETIEGYNVKPEKLPETLEWKDEEVKPFLEIAHRNNIPPKAMKELVAAHVAQQTQFAERMNYSQNQLLQKKFDDGIKDLQHTWGKNFDTNTKKVQEALMAVGCPLDDSGLISPNVVKAILNLRDMVSDDRFVSGSAATPAGGSGDPEQRALAIINDKDNPDYAKYHSRDPQTTAKVEALFKEGARLKQRR